LPPAIVPVLSRPGVQDAIEESSMRVYVRFLLLCVMVATFGQARALAQPTPAVDEAKPQPGDAPIADRPPGATPVVNAGQGPVAPSSHRTVWKVSLAASVGVTVGAVAFTAYSRSKVDSELEPGALMIMGNSGAGISSDDCGKSYQQILDGSQLTSFNYAALQRACTWRTRSYVGLVASGVGVLGIVVSLIMLTRETGPTEPAVTATRRMQHDVAIVPILTPDGGGASFSLRW
jgi:hypothetical protein